MKKHFIFHILAIGIILPIHGFATSISGLILEKGTVTNITLKNQVGLEDYSNAGFNVCGGGSQFGDLTSVEKTNFLSEIYNDRSINTVNSSIHKDTKYCAYNLSTKTFSWCSNSNDKQTSYSYTWMYPKAPDIILTCGKLTESYTGSKVDFLVDLDLLNDCGISLIGSNSYEISDNSQYSFNVNCTGNNHIKRIIIKSTAATIRDNNKPNGSEFYINGVPPHKITQKSLEAHGNIYEWSGSLEWELRDSKKCGETFVLLPSSSGKAITNLDEISAEFCPALIQSFDVSSTTVITLTGSTNNSKVKWQTTITNSNEVPIYAVTGSGPQIYVNWNGTDGSGNTVPGGTYTAILTAESDGCVDTKNVNFAIQSCNLAISEFKGSSQIIRPDSGGSIQLSGSISDSSDKPVNWALTVAGATYTGTGKTLSVTWDGKDAHGKVVEPGEYAATLTASTEDGKCSDSKTIWFQVRPADGDQCGLLVDFGSSAQLASGNLSHSQQLFSTRGTGLSTAMTLYYNSLDPHLASLGTGWSHSYDISLKRNSNGSVVVYSGNGKRRLYALAGGSYVSHPGDYSTLVKNADGTFTLTHKDGLKHSFGTDDRIAAIIDRNGNAVTFGYTGGNLTTATDPAGRVTTLNYDASNHLTSISNPAGNGYTFGYSGDTLSSATYPDGGQWRYTYDADAFMLSKTDPLGNTTMYTYDDKHRVVSSADPEGRTRSIAYPLSSETVSATTFTEKDGGIWRYSYDTIKGSLLAKTDPQGSTTSYTYDAGGNRTSVTAPDGTITSYTYDGQGNMASTTDPLGQTTSYTYNDFGQMTSSIDPQGNTTGYIYDDKGNVTAITDPAGATTRYEYNVKGGVTRVINPLGESTIFTYDVNSNLASITDPAGASTSFAYDAAGNVISQADTNGVTTRFEYDAKSRPVKTIDPAGNVTVYSYDMGGNKTSRTDANGNVTRYEYNFKGQVTKVTDALGNSTTYAYGGSACPSCGGGADKLTAITDANGNTTRYDYDQLGRRAKETDPLHNTMSYAYDAKGNLLSTTDGNGNTIKYSYDGLGRLLRKSYPDNSEETFAYDAKGNLLSAANQHIAFAYTYDAAGRTLSVTDSHGRSVQYGYDAAGRKIQTIYPDGSALRYSYDKAGRLATITDGTTAETYSIAYDNNGRRVGLTFPGGVTTSYGYDTAGRLTTLMHKATAGSTIAKYDYTNDKVGNRVTKAEPDRKTTYAYDKIYRLLQALPSNSHGRDKKREHKAENYSYDPAGNRLSGPEARDYYSYVAGNQLVADRGHQNSYDRNGNLIEKSGKDDNGKSVRWSYAYDYENRLIKVVKQEDDETINISFAYDPFGRRIEKRIEEVEHGKVEEAKTTTFAYDNEDIILEYVTKSDDGKSKTEATRYIHGPGIDEPLSIKQKGEVHYYHSDGLGSIVALTDAKQKVVERYEYDSFGNMKRHGDKVKNGFTYTGREWDKETGLYYYRARYYDPMEGRFIQKDPIGINGGINLYSYVRNNVINRTDPLGLFEYHGNWCGPDWTGGLKEQFTSGHVYKDPVDSLDSCCKDHDICYSECRKNNPCDLIERDLCMTRCDRKLATCAASAGHKFSSPLWWWMDFNSTPSPGPDAPSCGAK